MLLYKKSSKKISDIITEISSLLKDSTDDIWTSGEKLEAIKQSLRKLYPDVFTPKFDTSVNADGSSYSFTIPASFDLVMGIDVRANSEYQWQSVNFSLEVDGSGNNTFNLFDVYPAAYQFKIRGGAKLTVPTAAGDDLDVPQEAEDLVITGAKIELMEMTLLDKGKLNQFAAREQGVTEVDVMNMIQGMRREYSQRKSEISTLLISQVTRM